MTNLVSKVPATIAAKAHMRCAVCLRVAKVGPGQPDFILERKGSGVVTRHDGSCPQESGWG